MKMSWLTMLTKYTWIIFCMHASCIWKRQWEKKNTGCTSVLTCGVSFRMVIGSYIYIYTVEGVINV